MSAALYKRTVKWKKKKNKRLAKKKKKQEEDEFDEECTFKPKINKTYKLKNDTKNVFHDPLWKTDKPSRNAIKEHCKYLGIDTIAYPDLMYIGREALFAELPADGPGDVELETKANDIETKRNSQMAKYQSRAIEVKSNTADLDKKNKGRDNESVFILTVHSCQQLKRADAFGKSDPYCIIFQDSYEVGRTPVIKNTLEPQWNFEVEMYLKKKISILRLFCKCLTKT